MSKIFNEMQKANELALKQLEDRDLDLSEIIESVKLGSVGEAAPVEVEPDSPKIQLDEGVQAPLVLRQDQGARAVLEAYRGLRTKISRAQAKAQLRSIAISSSLPNEGKTLTVLNLGLCYSELPEQRVLIVDGDLRTRGLSTLLGRNVTSGLAEVLSGQVTPDEALLATDRKNLFAVLGSSSTLSPPELFASPRWAEFLAWCGEKFDIVLIDTPPILPLTDFELISAACDGILLIVRARQSEKETLRKTMSSLDPKKFLGAVLNATETNPKGHYGYGYGVR